MTPERFFTVAVVHAISERLKEFGAMRGVITFEVAGDKTYTVRLGNVEQPVIEGWEGPSNLWLTFEKDAFAAFTQGTLDLAGALDSRSLRVRGNPSFLSQFAQLMQARTSPLGARLGQF